MSNISAVVNLGKGSLSFCINNRHLDRLVTNIRLYQKDIIFVDGFIDDYGVPNCDQFLPSKSGIIFIDFVNNVILDSQRVTGINKFTPSEIRMALNGSSKDEPLSSSLVTRFKELVDAGYLKGFERWQDNGHHLDKSIVAHSYDTLIDLINRTSDYGQFTFSTNPFRVQYFETDWKDQIHLFNRAVEFNLIPETHFVIWNEYLEGLKA